MFVEDLQLKTKSHSSAGDIETVSCLYGMYI